MNKSAMKYLVRAWKKELKLPEWKMPGKKHRHACARSFASGTHEAVTAWHEVIDSQDSADDAVAEDVMNWND